MQNTEWVDFFIMNIENSCMDRYLPRIADEILKFKLRGKGAVLVEGPKWCGKSTTCRQQAKSVILMQDTETRDQNIALAYTSPSVLLDKEPPLLIDEWQEAPILWDAIRNEVDRRQEPGQFMLTGSVSPLDSTRKKEIHHSGIGRITSMMMTTMTLFESGDSNGTVSLQDLFAGRKIAASSDKNLMDYAYLTCRGGWPEAIGKEQDLALEQAFDYYEQLVRTDFASAVEGKYSQETLSKLIRSYSRHLSTPATKALIRKDVGSETFSDKTFDRYYNALNKLFVVQDIPAWNPNIRSRARIQVSPVRQFCDPSIAAAALGLGPQDLIDDLKTFGLFFESMCDRDLSVYASLLRGQLYHYRDSNGLEADAIIHLRNGSFGLIEMKLGRQSDIDEGAQHLRNLASIIDTEYMKAPSFLMVVTAKNAAYTRPDGVHVVPLACLRP